MTTRIYLRVSTGKQKTDSQEVDLKKLAESKAADGIEVKWYRDKFTGKTMDRPGLKKLLAEVQPGDEVVVWRLDRLGRTANGINNLFENLQAQKVNFISLRDGFDLRTAAGRMVAGILASVAAWETEVRAERVAAGLAAKRAKVEAGKDTWNIGRPKGTGRISPDTLATIRDLMSKGKTVIEVAKIMGLSRAGVYKALSRAKAEEAAKK